MVLNFSILLFGKRNKYPFPLTFLQTTVSPKSNANFQQLFYVLIYTNIEPCLFTCTALKTPLSQNQAYSQDTFQHSIHLMKKTVLFSPIQNKNRNMFTRESKISSLSYLLTVSLGCSFHEHLTLCFINMKFNLMFK